MTAAEIIQIRTGKTGSKVNSYITMSEMQVRNYLHLSVNASLENYQFAIADIAIFLMDKDEYSADPSSSFVKSESFSEGGVSSSVTYSDKLDYYDRCIEAVLKGLDVTARKIKFM